MNHSPLPLVLKTALLGLLLLLRPAAVQAIGAAGDTDWPKGATVEVRIELKATIDKDGQPQVAGELMVTNPTQAPLLIQEASNRLVLAFLVFDALGNPVAPRGVSKTDPAFGTLSVAPGGTYKHPFETLNFVTGSIEQSYALSRGNLYRVVAVYRPAGPHGPGFTSPETPVQIPS